MAKLSVTVEETVFTTDKDLLMEHSEYFRALFQSGMRESTQDQIQLHNLGALGFLITLRVLKGERPLLSCEEILQAVECASFLQVELLTKHLVNLIDSDNCLAMFQAAATYGLLDLFHASALYIRDIYDMLEEDIHCLPPDLVQYIDSITPSTFVAVGAHTPTIQFLEDASRTMCFLDEEKNQWQSLGCIPEEASTFLAGVTTMNNKVFIVGGARGANKQVVEKSFCYDGDQHSWSEFASPHQLRYEVTLVGHEGHLYAFGGEYERVPVASVEKYSLTSKIWTFGQELPQAVAGPPATKAMGRVFICLWKPQETTIIYEYDTCQDELIPISSIRRMQSYGHCMVGHRDDLYIMRNGPSDDFLRCAIENYNLSTQQWTTLSGQYVNSKGALFTAVIRGDTVFTLNRVLTLLYRVDNHTWKPIKEKTGFNKGGSLHTFFLRLPTKTKLMASKLYKNPHQSFL
ncbi:kelch repeat and BTB domain-containing protein 13 [Rana temporaria]|uniref:kelch repeat and BTB domain-containing protein 13 n=1 Tax=Rana temporaria TaxID=8407 RepID=UPI001AAD1078|nr:kelch repeat and BTB domain-containing protein 13 [Rana temporaria]